MKAPHWGSAEGTLNLRKVLSGNLKKTKQPEAHNPQVANFKRAKEEKERMKTLGKGLFEYFNSLCFVSGTDQTHREREAWFHSISQLFL